MAVSRNNQSSRRSDEARLPGRGLHDVGEDGRRFSLAQSVRWRRMAQQIVHRLLISFPALLGVLFLCFCLLQVVPADPAAIIAGPDAKAETIAAIRQQLGLDRPII